MARTPEQCRTHHQKLQQRTTSSTLDEIIEIVRQRLSQNKKKQKIKTTADQEQGLQEEGFVVLKDLGKEIKIILNLELVGDW